MDNREAFAICLTCILIHTHTQSDNAYIAALPSLFIDLKTILPTKHYFIPFSLLGMILWDIPNCLLSMKSSTKKKVCKFPQTNPHK